MIITAEPIEHECMAHTNVEIHGTERRVIN